MISLICLLFLPFVNGDRIVQTNSGPIRGITVDTQNVEAFLGVPYAEPPLGKLRFKRPLPKLPWTEIFDANELPPACVQSMMKMTSKFINQQESKMDEDCLYLNLWVPRNSSTQKPVMVYIHGGAFMTGSSNAKFYDGANLSQHGNVIVASMNYRVGTLGFFSAFNDDVAGNMGMYDQILAIQWIKDNAKYFGGDADNIVLFGESAGGISVSLHMVSPMSKSLFKRAILQSGTAVHPMFSDDNSALRMGSQMISKLLGCATTDEDLTENPKNVVECMKKLPSDKFPEADEVLFKNFLMLVPRVGDEFLPLNPTDLYRKGEFKDSEVLLGVTRDEGSLFVALQLSYKNGGDIFGEMIDSDAFNETSAKEISGPLTNNEHYSKILQNYFKKVEEQSRYTYLNAVSDIIGDSLLTCPSIFQADFQSRGSHPVYFYVFDYRSPSSRFPEWMGVPHSEDIPYVFGNFLHKKVSTNEEQFSRDVMDMWVSFAKTGDPSIAGGLKWPKYTYNDPKYLIIDMREKTGVKPDNYRCEAWRNLYRATVDDKIV